MKKLKYDILFIILFMTIGIAAVTSNLTINGTSPIAANTDEFDVYFANIDDESVNPLENVVVSSTDTSFKFYVNLSGLGSGIDLTFDVVNASSIYDADVELNCTESDEYLNITASLSDQIIHATDKVSGSLYVGLRKSYIGDSNLVKEITCSIVAEATERDTLSEGDIPVPDESYPMLLSTSLNDTTAFRSGTYKEKIKKIEFKNQLNVPIENSVDTWDIGVAQNGNVIASIYSIPDDSSYYHLVIKFDEKLYANPDMSYWFANFTNLDEIIGLEFLDTSKVTNMKGMFQKTGYNSSKFTLDLSGFRTNNVTNMNGMFDQTGFSSSVFQLDVSNFDTSNVKNMRLMFQATGYSNDDFTLDVSGFNTSKVTNMEAMFNQTGLNSDDIQIDVSGFDTRNVTKMGGMFQNLGSNNPNFILNVSNFVTSKVTDMRVMFANTGYLSSKFTLDVSGFDTSNVTNMSGMFYSSGYSNPDFILDVSGFDTSKVTDMMCMFNETGYINPSFVLDVSGFDTSNVVNFEGMFQKTGYSSTIFNLDVSNFVTVNATDMSHMFNKAGYSSNEFNLDLNNFNTENVTDFSYMLNKAGYNSTKFNTSISIKNPNVTSYTGMFLDVATKTGAQIKVNYISSTSSLVDSMIATKTSGANVVKGELID